MKILLSSLALFVSTLCLHAADTPSTGVDDRRVWCDTLCKIAAPVLKEMSEGNLQKNMSLELSPSWDGRNQKVTYMEAFGRTMAGLAPWLSLPADETEEGKMREQMKQWALKSYTNAVDPESPDYLLWRKEYQTLVDAAYIAESFLRAYDALWLPLDDITKARYIEEFQLLRRVDPPNTNWLLFSATVEAFLCKAGASYDAYRISSTLRTINSWYVGDGWYSDGEHFAFDYYNSYVIHPMYMECLGIITKDGTKGQWNVCRKEQYGVGMKRMQKHAATLERLISPEGTLPVFGRSIPYRSGALQALSWIAWQKQLPKDVSPAQVRAGITAVLKNMFTGDDNFDEKGYLRIGYVGHQPNIANDYTNNGSLYMATLAFLALGLPADDPFWTMPYEDWTSKKAWTGQDFPQDHAYKEY